MPKLAMHLAPDAPIGDIVDRAQHAERAGADSVYVIEGSRDPFVPLGAIAAATTRISIGTYIANAYARTPQAAATAALAIDELSDGRVTCGIGAGNRHVNERLFGLDVGRPLGKMQDYVAVLRVFLQGDTGNGRQVGGPIHHTDTRLVPSPARRVPIVVAAVGPKMTDLAATMSDGVGLAILVGAEHIAQVVRPRAVAACEAAGRDAAQLRFPMAALTSVDDDETTARAQARRAIVGLFRPTPHPRYEYLLREQGYPHVADAVLELMSQNRRHEAMAAIDDELIDRLTITGTPAQCAARFADYEGLADEIVCLSLGAPEPTPNTARPGDEALARAFALAVRF